ncbi:MscL family protein [Candidatus Nanosynbacter sp. TM7-057]|uniref:MscL family protein n=1 Tax=Candidatus Nanosynbacter sp. TM7-057 TaxID=2902630 RepID=UPI001FB73347|nr:MscL family protein [Candidatus Nanosynbacter sp. TM7-057]MCJ1964717.1 MscL family protein [Candidatus Nanosynbacter sp. TM7-057]
MKSSESTKGSKVSAKKLASKSVKAAAKVAALKKKKIVNVAIKDTHMAGFVDFIREQGVVGMAVGLAIGTAAGDTVKKLVTAFIDPLVQLVVGSQQGLQSASFTVEVAGRKGEFLYGAFVSSLITLIAVAFVVYAIIHFLKLDKLDKKKD